MCAEDEHMEREVDIICTTLLSDVPNATFVSKEVLYKKEYKQSKFYQNSAHFVQLFPWSDQVNCSTWRFSNIDDQILSLLL